MCLFTGFFPSCLLALPEAGNDPINSVFSAHQCAQGLIGAQSYVLNDEQMLDTCFLGH